MFTINSSMHDVFTTQELAPYRKFLMYSGAAQNTDPAFAQKKARTEQAPLSGLAHIGWSPEGIVSGLNCLLEAVADNRVQQYFIYDAAECAGNAEMEDVNFIRITPAHPKPDAPIVILCAGGGYTSVCTMVEALPTARHMLELGYETFLFTYRVRTNEAALKALDDLAAGIRYLNENSRSLGIDATRYAIGGFSAGANLISGWGVPEFGYHAYNLPKPLAMFPIYTFIDLKAAVKWDKNGVIQKAMFGSEYRSFINQFNIAEHIDADYPPCYIVCGKDDNTVPPNNSELMKELLDAAGVPAVLEEGAHAPHGFGDGTGTDVEGWPQRAVAFLEKLV